MADTETAPTADPAPQNGIKRGSAEIADHAEVDAKRPGTPSTDAIDSIQIKVQFGKVNKVVTRRLDSTVGDLKAEIELETGVPVANQKLLFKGQLKDER
jgi:hypothetical protein